MSGGPHQQTFSYLPQTCPPKVCFLNSRSGAGRLGNREPSSPELRGVFRLSRGERAVTFLSSRQRFALGFLLKWRQQAPARPALGIGPTVPVLLCPQSSPHIFPLLSFSWPPSRLGPGPSLGPSETQSVSPHEAFQKGHVRVLPAGTHARMQRARALGHGLRVVTRV